VKVKKVISLSFLLLANVVMLAHSVIFHHHDDLIPVVVCNVNHENHCSDAENPSKCCIVQNCLLCAPYTKADDFKQIKPVLDNFEFIADIFSANQITQITDLAALPFRQKPYLLPFYSEFVAQSIGLRASPVC